MISGTNMYPRSSSIVFIYTQGRENQIYLVTYSKFNTILILLNRSLIRLVMDKKYKFQCKVNFTFNTILIYDNQYPQGYNARTRIQ